MLIERIKQAIADTADLLPRYRRITTTVGIVAGLAGCAGVLFVMYYSRMAFGLPMEAAPLAGIRLRFLAWLGGCVISIPLIFYAAMVLVGGGFGLAMVMRGSMSLSEARAYAFFGSCPVRWFADRRSED